MRTKKVYLRGLTEKKMFKLNKDFEGKVKLKKIKKANKNRDYFTH